MLMDIGGLEMDSIQNNSNSIQFETIGFDSIRFVDWFGLNCLMITIAAVRHLFKHQLTTN